MKHTVKRVLILAAGWSFMVLGVVGLFLPVLQGVLFLLIGLSILSTQHEWAHRWLMKLRHKFPTVATKSEETRARLSRWWDRHFRGTPAPN